MKKILFAAALAGAAFMTACGGKDGGGSVVTEEGREMMQRYGNFLSALQTEADRLFAFYFQREGEK